MCEGAPKLLVPIARIFDTLQSPSLHESINQLNLKLAIARAQDKAAFHPVERQGAPLSPSRYRVGTV